jgi:hypothetical protein
MEATWTPASRALERTFIDDHRRHAVADVIAAPHQPEVRMIDKRIIGTWRLRSYSGSALPSVEHLKPDAHFYTRTVS